MLGPALNRVLQNLKKVPLQRRTAEHAALMRELELLSAAMSPDDREIGHGMVTGMHAEPNIARLDPVVRRAHPYRVDNLTVTEPERGSVRICPICGADVP
jgi:hypothetical protein